MELHNIEVACKAAYENGRMDFLAGGPCDPTIPLKVYDNLTPEQQTIIMQFWLDGWDGESLMQSLPDGMPA
jgi:hypothetical protein